MQELSEFNISQKENINKLQNQLLDYEQTNCKVLEELKVAKENSDDLLKKITDKNNMIMKLEEELKKTINDKDIMEKELNHKLTHYKNKLEVSLNELKI